MSFIKKASDRFRADSKPAQEMMLGPEEETFLQKIERIAQ